MYYQITLKDLKNMCSSQNELLFKKYEFLAKQHAKKMFDTNKIGMDFDDVLQEFRIKLYTSILAYWRSIEVEKARGVELHVPIEMYLGTCMRNHKVDMISEITGSKSSHKSTSVIDFCPDYDIDFSQTDENIYNIDLDNYQLEINGVDIFSGLSPVQVRIYTLYLKGTEINKLQLMFGKHMNVKKFIKERTEMMKKQKSSIVFETTKTIVHKTALIEA